MLSNIAHLYICKLLLKPTPHLFRNGLECERKENAYVFDFDPARTLIIYGKIANNLSLKTAGGGGSSKEEENIKELLNFSQ